MLKTLLSYIRDLFVVALVFAVSAVSLLGAKVPFQFPLYSFGAHQVSVFDSGIAVFQQDRGNPYYAFSPLSDFYITSDGKKTSFLTWEDFEAGKFEVTEKKHYEQLIDVITSFFKKDTIVYEMKRPGVDVVYEGIVEDDKLTVTRNLQLDTNEDITQIAMTLKFASNDIVIDLSNGNVIAYGDWQDVLNVNAKGELGFLTPAEAEESVAISSNSVAIINPNHTGAIVVENVGEGEMKVDSSYYILEVTTPFEKDTNVISSQIKITSLNDLIQLKKAI